MTQQEYIVIARPKAFDREKALVQALQLFWRIGYAATSMEDLSSSLHLSRSSPYATFGDKRTLFLEALRFYRDRVLQRTAQTLHEASSPLAGIATLFDELTVGIGSEAGAAGCFMVNAVAELVPYDADVTEIARSYSDALQHLFAEALVQAGVPQVVANERTPQQLAGYLFNTMQGLRIMIKSGATREHVDAVIAITLASLH